tara:strand:+ start:15956 stop:16705 length:750 start_codon:yes stop_codon:yes gene_type:complete
MTGLAPRSDVQPPMAAPEQSMVDLDWNAIAADLNATGQATIGPVLSVEECNSLIEAYDQQAFFRSRVVMARHGFGRGEYQYFNYPLPDLIATLRHAFYPHLAAIANQWLEMTGRVGAYPADHADYLRQCHEAGQGLPTPLMLKYQAGDYNCLHQDIYGDHLFPLQIAILLSDPARDFTGGEFVLTEQRPRMQSRAEVVALAQGQAVIFPVNARPVRGTRGVYRVRMRHGVSRVRSGQRHVLGLIFHDAR